MKCVPSASSSFPADLRGVAVRRDASGWPLSSTANDVSGHFPTQAEAVTAAKRAIARQGGTLLVEDTNGRITQTLTLGRDAAVRLNGIEGLAMNTASRRLLRDVQTSGMTPAQQRSAISAAFKK